MAKIQTFHFKLSSCFGARIQSCVLCFRYELVPKSIKEDEFWRNYFYRVNLIKQSFDLKDLEANSKPMNNSSKSKAKEQNNHETDEVVDNTGK